MYVDCITVTQWIYGYRSEILKAALKAFQIASNIELATGYFGPKTHALIKTLANASSTASVISMATSTAFTRDLQEGMSGPDVTLLQTLLIHDNAGPAAQTLLQTGTSTYFGSVTKAALIEYQQQQNIVPALGYFGLKTRAIMVQ
ncbi:MAG: peptidoglycan-binding domain-containing protein [Candidatus Pacebacteria bacterium]|nr:peptidoglycan-binding domain-containing protein [Candidatus Paceibacterota bacterium]